MIFLPLKDKNIRIHPSKIIYADTEMGCTTVYMNDDSMYSAICSLDDFLKLLSQTVFIRIHRSHIVNTDYITGILGNTLILNDKKLLIGKTYRSEFMERITVVGSKRRSYGQKRPSRLKTSRS